MIVSPETSFAFIGAEDPLQSRVPIAILYPSGPSLAAGTVISQTSVAASKTANVSAGNRNIAVAPLTMDPTTPVAPGALTGTYEVRLTGSGPTASFNVIDPLGNIISTGNAATEFVGAVSFTLAALLPGGISPGGTMVVGDRWYIQVSVLPFQIIISPAASNVGTGALMMATKDPAMPGAYLGNWKILLTSTGPTAAFNVIDPTGAVVGSGNVGTAFTSGPVNFILAAGGTMTIGDTWLVAISQAGASLWGVLDTSKTNGLQIAAGVLLNTITAGSGAQQAMALTRSAAVILADLIWPSGFTASQIAEAVNYLATNGIICR